MEVVCIKAVFEVPYHLVEIKIVETKNREMVVILEIRVVKGTKLIMVLVDLLGYLF